MATKAPKATQAEVKLGKKAKEASVSKPVAKAAAKPKAKPVTKPAPVKKAKTEAKPKPLVEMTEILPPPFEVDEKPKQPKTDAEKSNMISFEDLKAKLNPAPFVPKPKFGFLK